MSTASAAAPAIARVTGWDRAVVIVLGAAGCALSYDALQQMAIAVHIRGPLTYLFPLVIDGFIAYGVRALLVLRDAPLRARAYVWTLFGAATGASLWANALHAIRLNQQSAATGLRLGDTVVAVLSTIAPLALAGAVHLYILIARGQVNPADRDAGGDLGQEHQGECPGALTGGQDSAGQPEAGRAVNRSVTPKVPPLRLTADGLTEAADRDAHSDSIRPVSDRVTERRPVGAAPVTSVRPFDLGGQSVTAYSVSSRAAGDRRTDLDTEELLDIARKAVEAEDKLTRKVVAQAIRGQQIPLSSDTLTQLMAQLRAQHGQPIRADRD